MNPLVSCTACNQEITADTKFCPSCGLKVTSMTEYVRGEFDINRLLENFRFSDWELDIPEVEDGEEMKTFWVKKPGLCWWRLAIKNDQSMLNFFHYYEPDKKIPIIDHISVANKINLSTMLSVTSVLIQEEPRFLITIVVMPVSRMLFSDIEKLIAEADEEWHEAAKENDFGSFLESSEG